MALSLYQRYMTRRNPPPPAPPPLLSPAASAASFRDVADSVVFGPPGALRGGPPIGPAVVTYGHESNYLTLQDGCPQHHGGDGNDRIDKAVEAALSHRFGKAA